MVRRMSEGAYSNDAPFQSFDQEWLHVLGSHAFKESNLDVVEKLRCDGDGIAHEDTLSGLRSTIVACLYWCREDVVESDHIRRCTQVLVIIDAIFSVVNDEIEDCEGAIECETAMRLSADTRLRSR